MSIAMNRCKPGAISRSSGHFSIPMYHLVEKVNGGRSRHWWIRLGTNDTDTSHVVSANLAAAAAKLGDDVNRLYFYL